MILTLSKEMGCKNDYIFHNQHYSTYLEEHVCLALFMYYIWLCIVEHVWKSFCCLLPCDFFTKRVLNTWENQSLTWSGSYLNAQVCQSWLSHKAAQNKTELGGGSLSVYRCCWTFSAFEKHVFENPGSSKPTKYPHQNTNQIYGKQNNHQTRSRSFKLSL